MRRYPIPRLQGLGRYRVIRQYQSHRRGRIGCSRTGVSLFSIDYLMKFAKYGLCWCELTERLCGRCGLCRFELSLRLDLLHDPGRDRDYFD